MVPRAASLRGLFGARVFAIHSQPQFFADLKKRDAFSGHRHQNPALRVSSLTRSPVFYDETSKAAYFDAVALRKSVHHGIEDSIDDHFRISSRKMRKSFVHLVNQIPFRHNISLTTQQRISIDVWTLPSPY